MMAVRAVLLALVVSGCASSSIPVSELKNDRTILVTSTDGRKLVFTAGEYRIARVDSGYAIVGKGRQIEDRFGPTSITLTDSLPPARIEEISAYDPQATEGPTGWYFDALKVIVPIGVVVGLMLL